MKKQEMKNLIFQELTLALSETDFRLKKSEDSFIRMIPGGRQMLGLPFWDYHPEFEFSLVMSIRLEAVEDIFHLFSGTPPKYQAMGDTTITPLVHFTGEPAKYKVTTADEVKAAFGGLTGVIREKIVPFFDEHKDVKSLDRAVNWRQPGIDITQPPWGPVNSIILAHLAGNPDFERLVAKHRSEMHLGADVDHPFNRVVAYLKNSESARVVGHS